MSIKLKDVRLLYAAALHKPQKGPNGEGEPKYSATFAFPPNHPVVAEIKAAMKKCAEEKWKDKAAEIFIEMKAGNKLCLKDGDAKASKEGYKGNLFISASNKLKPLLIDGRLQPIGEDSGKLYSGCYVNATIDLWAMDNKWGKRINASLQGVQFLRDGQRLSGGGVSSVEDYEAIPEAEAPAGEGAKPAAPTGGSNPDPFA